MADASPFRRAPLSRTHLPPVLVESLQKCSSNIFDEHPCFVDSTVSHRCLLPLFSSLPNFLFLEAQVVPIWWCVRHLHQPVTAILLKSTEIQPPCSGSEKGSFQNCRFSRDSIKHFLEILSIPSAKTPILKSPLFLSRHSRHETFANSCPPSWLGVV